MRSLPRAAVAALGTLRLTGLICVSGLVGLICLSTPAPAVAAAAPSTPVVLIATSGLTWSEVEDGALPTLGGLLQDDASGWLADRSVRALTCQADGWLAVSAGKRAADLEPPKSRPNDCRQPQVQLPVPGGEGVVQEWPDYLRQAKADTYQAGPGLLGNTLARAGKSAASVGPGAAIALADGQGRVAHAWPGTASTLVSDVQAAITTSPDLLVVDLGPTLPDQTSALDARLGQVLAQLPANATVIVASIADAAPPSQLQLLAARGPAPLGGEYSRALLGSTSTRQDALAQTTDLLPTLLRALHVTVPDEAVGSALKPVEQGKSAAHRRQKLDDVGAASGAIKSIVPWFFSGLEVAQLLLYGVATLILRRRRNSPDAVDQATDPGRRRTLAWLRVGSVVFASVPIATFLANILPWWRFEPQLSSGVAVTVATLIFVVPIVALAVLGPWRNALLGPLGAVAVVTAVVLGGDVVTGSHLMLSSLMGVQPVVAGRFYGFGNPAFAIFVTGALLAAAALAEWQVRLGRPRVAALLVALVGIAATVVDGTPGFGSDFGGPPAILPAFAVLALLVAGVKVSWRRVLLIAAVTIVVVVSLSLLDWARGPGNRTHLGQFVQTAIDGGAWPVIQRKADQNVKIIFTSWLTALLPVAVAFVVLVLARPVAVGVRPLQLAYDRSPLLRHTMIAFGILMLLAAGLNDSGLAIPAVAAMVALPLLIAASVRTLELLDDERQRPAATADTAMARRPAGSPG